jgi:hypothetical protein
MCELHYKRIWANIELEKPVRAPRGSGFIDANGYKWIYVDGKRMAEHRHFMEQHLRRPLESHENVHHINGVRDDNRLENLELWSTSQPAGQRIKDKLEWAKMIIDKYDMIERDDNES